MGRASSGCSRWRSTTVLVAVLAGIGLAGLVPPAGAESNPPAGTPTKPAPVLYTVSASGGTLIPGSGKGTFVLALTGVNPSATWFTDRPARRAGTASVGGTLKSVGFGNDPPNAVIEVPGAPANQDAMAVTLRDPVYDEGAATLQFAAERLPKVGADLKGFRPELDPELAPNFGAVALFIDDGDAPVITGTRGNSDDQGKPNGSPSCDLTFKNPSPSRLGLLVLMTNFYAHEDRPWQGPDFAAFRRGNYTLAGGKEVHFVAPFHGAGDSCGAQVFGILTLDGQPRPEFVWRWTLDNPNFGDSTVSCSFQRPSDLLKAGERPVCTATVNARGQPAVAKIDIGVVAR